jgi:hypothetical protein
MVTAKEDLLAYNVVLKAGLENVVGVVVRIKLLLEMGNKWQ